MKKYFWIALVIFPVLFSCRKKVNPESAVYRSFDLGFTWSDKPQSFKVWDDALVLGFVKMNGDSTQSFRLIGISKDGAVTKNTSITDKDLFPGYNRIFSNIVMYYENEKLYVSALAMKTGTLSDSYYMIFTEFNSSLEKINTIERKILIGGLSVNEHSNFFITPLSGGFIFSANCFDSDNKPMVYQEVTDQNFYTLKYWKKPDLSILNVQGKESVFYCYAISGSGTPKVYSYDDSGNLIWTHAMDFTNTNPDLKLIKDLRMKVTSSGLLLSICSTKDFILPVISYLVDFSGSKKAEHSLSFSNQNYLNFTFNDNNSLFYAGQSCSAANTCKPYWAKYDEDLKLIFSKVLPEKFSHNMSALYVNETADGYSIFGLKDDFSSKVPDAFFLKTDKEGNISNR